MIHCGSLPGPGMKREVAGFTLLEVMMALVIVSIALVALVQSSQGGANTLAQAKEKTAALFIANQVLMNAYRQPSPATGQMQGERAYQDRLYFWKIEWQSTDNARIQRLEVEVSLQRDFDYLQAQLTGFKSS